MLAVCVWSDRATAQAQAHRADRVAARTAAAQPRPPHPVRIRQAWWVDAMPRRALLTICLPSVALLHVALPKLDLVAICLI